MNTSELTAMLRDRYTGREWAFLTEVPNGTGTAKSRSCDAMSMSLWPSKGLHIHGHEIKVTRSDWLQEIQDPTKSHAFSRHCHYWWIVAPKGVVKIEEMPPNWGLMQPGTKTIRVKRLAKLEEPEAINHSMLAGLLRAATQQSETEHKIRSADANGYRRGYDDGRKSAQRHAAVEKETDDRKEAAWERSIREFELASGVRIGMYSGAKIGKAVKLLMSTESPEFLAKRARLLSIQAKSLADVYEEIQEEISQ